MSNFSFLTHGMQTFLHCIKKAQLCEFSTKSQTRFDSIPSARNRVIELAGPESISWNGVAGKEFEIRMMDTEEFLSSKIQS